MSRQGLKSLAKLVAALLLSLALGLVTPALAQLGTADSGTPINVESDSGIEWQQDKQIYIARGNAVATRGPASIKADTLIAHYRQAKAGTANANANAEGNTEIYRIEAEGNVVVTRDTRTVVGDRLDYDVDQGVGIMRGKTLKMTTAADTVTARDALEWYDTKQIGVARGDAVAVHNARTVKADILTAYMVKTAPPGQAPAPGKPPAPPAGGKTPAAAGKPPDKPGATPAAPSEDSKIDRIDAQGHVVVIGAEDIGRGDYAVYNATTGICTLLGHVVITRGKDVITGQYAVMDMNRNISRILPASTLPGSTQQRVQGVFVKQDAPGQGTPGQPAPKSSSPPASPTPAKPAKPAPPKSP
jgi:lipopolysaccharide export system protein LptA